MSIKKCPSCKHENEEGAKFCSKCGTKLIEKKQHVPEPQSGKASNSNLFLFGALILAVVVIFLVLNSNLSSYQAKLEGRTEKGLASSTAKQGPPPEVMAKVLALKEQLSRDPNNYDLNVEMGNNYFDIGRYEKAVKNYLRAVNKRANDPAVLIDLGVSYFNLGKLDSAKIYMGNALLINPKHQQGLYNMGIVQFNEGDTTKALKYWKRLIAVGGISREAQTAKKFVDKLTKNRKS